MGYLAVGLLAFLLGILVTQLLLHNKKMQQTEKEES